MQHKPIACFILGIVLFWTELAHAQTPTVVYRSGEDGYDTYRIPAVIRSPGGDLLAFCEGRKSSRSDTGNIDLLVKRSTDGGTSWGPALVVWDEADNTCGNPCPVVDKETGVIWLLMTWNLGTDHERDIISRRSKDTRRVYVTSSKDDGETWAAPKEITDTTKLASWTWYATGPCSGIQLEQGPHKGRLLIPCDHIEAKTRKYYSHVIYSDDHGATWNLGGSTPTDMVNECQAVELPDGRIMLNMRNYDRTKKNRAVSISADGGMTWGPLRRDPQLPEPICQASIIKSEVDGKPILLFSNPASQHGRIQMTLKGSFDNGTTWPVAKLLHAGPSAYSDLVALPGGEVGVLYEAGKKHPYETITFERHNLKAIGFTEK